MNYLIYDAVIVAILLVFFFLGRKKGLVLTLCGLAAVFVAFFGARMATQALTPQVTEAIQPYIHSTVAEHLDAGLEGSLDELLNSEDSVVADTLRALGLHDALTGSVETAIEENTAHSIADAATAISTAVARVVAGVLIFIAAFLILLLVWSLVSRLLDLAARLPVINFLNRTLGGLAGLVKGCLLLFLAAWVLRLTDDIIPRQAVEQTVLLRFFFHTNPLDLISGI